MSEPLSNSSDPVQERRELISRLVDGECREADAERACRHWQSAVEAKADWHLYHLIGDVLRSDELAHPASRDAQFMASLSQRLAREPIPIAPPLYRRTDRRSGSRWASSVAAVAGFAAVGVAVLALRPQAEYSASWAGAQSVAVPAASGVFRTAGASSPQVAPQTLLVDGQVIRDARLDAYFDAHRGAVGPVSPAMPGGALRSVEILMPQR